MANPTSDFGETHPISEWQQYFPTYKFTNYQVAFKEFEVANRSLETEERIFLNATQITLVIGAALGSLVVGAADKIAANLQNVLPAYWTLIILIGLACVFSLTTLRYFADRRRAIVFAARKVIVLRRMLGVSYGTQQLVLPNWRIEGADEPFVVRTCPGWNTHVFYPFWILASFSVVVVIFLSASLFNVLISEGWVFLLPTRWAAVTTGTLWAGWLALSYRKALFDLHETFEQLVSRVLAMFLRIRLESNFEYIMYRAKLAVFEASRLRISLNQLEKMLVFIEDREFLNHSGISYKGLLRAALSIFGLKKRTGGSTITQQLARTLFIIDYHKTLRRKIVEIFLAKWIERVFDKESILDMHLVSVRFEYRVLGVVKAMHYFFGHVLRAPTIAQAFFLVERISNVRSRILPSKVDETIRNSVNAGIMTQNDAREVIDIYVSMVNQQKLRPDNDQGFKRLCTTWQRPNI